MKTFVYHLRFVRFCIYLKKIILEKKNPSEVGQDK